MSLPPDQPALGAYLPDPAERARLEVERVEWVRWLIADHCARERAKVRVEAALVAAHSALSVTGADFGLTAERLRALADQLS